MKIEYRVHRVSGHMIPTQATLPGGEPVEATVIGIEVELVPTAGPSSSITLRYVGADRNAAAAFFHEGDVVAVPWDQTKGGI